MDKQERPSTHGSPVLTAAAAGFAFFGALRAAGAGADKLTMAVPGLPPDFTGLPAFVARDAGFCKHYGLNLKIKPMASGAGAAKAVLAGRLDLAFAPTQFALRLAANSQAPIKAIWGLERPDWVLASMDKTKRDCTALAAGAVGVDAKRGTRWVQLNTILARKCRLRIDKDVKTEALGGNIVSAMATGRLTFAILHLDEVAGLQHASGKGVHVITMLEAAAPGLHHMMLIARADKIAEKRPAFVRLVAALRDASGFIQDPANLSQAAAMAAPTRRSPKDAEFAIKALNAFSFYPAGTSGLDRSRIAAALANQIKLGRHTKGRSGIKPGTASLAYEDIVDATIWRDAGELK